MLFVLVLVTLVAAQAQGEPGGVAEAPRALPILPPWPLVQYHPTIAAVGIQKNSLKMHPGETGHKSHTRAATKARSRSASRSALGGDGRACTPSRRPSPSPSTSVALEAVGTATPVTLSGSKSASASMAAASTSQPSASPRASPSSSFSPSFTGKASVGGNGSRTPTVTATRALSTPSGSAASAPPSPSPSPGSLSVTRTSTVTKSMSKSISLTRSHTSSNTPTISLSPSPGSLPSPQVTGLLTYYGGPVIQNIRVLPVFWAASLNQAALTEFYFALVSPSGNLYFGLLAQYRTFVPPQAIEYGSSGAPLVVAGSLPPNVTDSDIRSMLSGWFASGLLPAPTPNNNNYYPLHFPPGVTVGSGTSLSCTAWCGYHSTFLYAGAYVYYGVIPDLSSPHCGCWASPTLLDNVQSVSSHELFEAITDPRVGSGRAWYYGPGGEIGDLCAWQMASVPLGGKVYTVQKQWSDLAGRCAVTY